MAVAVVKSPIEELVKSAPNATGIALILANDYNTKDKRPGRPPPIKGPHKDASYAKEVFESLGTVCHKVLNAGEAETMRACRSVAGYHYDTEKYKWIVVVFSGHGKREGELWGQDGSIIHIERMIDLFQPENSPQNAVIPKVFLFDMCRGEEISSSILVSRGDEEPGNLQARGGKVLEQLRMPAEGNMLIAYSTLPRMKAFESDTGGLWLFHLLRRLQDQNSSISEILNDVNEDVNKDYQSCKDDSGRHLMQQPEHRSTLHGNVYFLKEARKRRGLDQEIQKELEDMDLQDEEVPMEQEMTASRSTVKQSFDRSFSTPASGLSYTQELNKLCKEKTIVLKRQYTDHGADNHVTLEITMKDDKKVTFNSSINGSHFGCINDARESVARAAVDYIKSYPQSNVPYLPRSHSSPQPVACSSGGSGASPLSGPPAVQLKNILVDQRKLEPPHYDDEEDPTKTKKKFRCIVRHSSFKEPIIGNWCRSKSDAKQDAAEKALKIIQEEQ